MFEITKDILKDWLDHAQRESGYRCEQKFELALKELDEAEKNKCKCHKP